MATAAGEGQRSISLYFRPAGPPPTNAEVHDMQRQGPLPRRVEHGYQTTGGETVPPATELSAALTTRFNTLENELCNSMRERMEHRIVGQARQDANATPALKPSMSEAKLQ
eukprot:gene44246-19713_t